MWASQVAPGNENALRIRVFGDNGGLEWAQEQPNTLRYMPFGAAPQIITRGAPAAGPDTARVTRIPGGHPESYLEAFATIYSEIAMAISARASGQPFDALLTFPTLHDGVRGVQASKPHWHRARPTRRGSAVMQTGACDRNAHPAFSNFDGQRSRIFFARRAQIIPGRRRLAWSQTIRRTHPLTAAAA